MCVSAYFPAVLFSAASYCVAAPTLRPKRAVGFAADPSINAAGILSSAKGAGGNLLATFPTSQGSADNVKIFGDWEDLDGVSMTHFIADMDVGCVGVDHNPDGQPDTSFGRLDATKSPWYVLPLSFHEDQPSSIKPNALGAIICHGNMFYGIFGDENGAERETCFPDDGLDGGKGYGAADVLYVVFGQEVPSGAGDETIDVAALKTLGDQQARKLANALDV